MDAPTAGRVRVGRWDLHGDARAGPGRLPPPDGRFRVAADLAQPAAVPDGPAERRAADDRGPVGNRSARADELLDLVGVGHVADRQPQEMSGGEQQRVAIATALANEPQLLLADEPTGELDTATAREVFDALRTANREFGTTVVVVTHDPAVSGLVERTVAIRDGRTSSEVLRRDADGDVTHEEYAVMDRAGPGPGAAGVPRGAGADPPGAARARGRPRGRLARRQRTVSAVPGAAVQVRDVHRTFGSGRSAVHALRGVDLDVAPGELVALVGRSGSGKTTLLNVVGGLDRPDEGSVLVDEVDVGRAERRRAGPAAARPGRVRLPDVRADTRADGGGERRRPDAAARGAGGRA